MCFTTFELISLFSPKILTVLPLHFGSFFLSVILVKEVNSTISVTVSTFNDQSMYGFDLQAILGMQL